MSGSKSIYVLGPMRGYPQFNFPAFFEAEAKLLAEGWCVYNPARMDGEGFDYNRSYTAAELAPMLSVVIRRDLLTIIDHCSAVYALPGWEKSAGANTEMALAKFLRLDILGAVERPRIIGIMGRAGSGKSAVATILGKHGFMQYGFADSLKCITGLLFGLSREQMYGGLKDTEDSRYGLSPRVILQHMGTEVGRSVYPDIWIEALRRTMNPKQNYVIDDVRFPNEAMAIRSWGGELWLVRGRGYGIGGHASEQVLEEAVAPDTIINNTGTLEQLENSVISNI